MQEKKQLYKTSFAAVVFVGTLGFMATTGQMTGKHQEPVFHLDKQISIRGQRLNLEFAETSAQVTQGLSDRVSMKDDQGMLFLLGETRIHPFWMNRMYFPLDIIWIKNGTIVEIAPNLPPPSNTLGVPVMHEPAAEANEVLELTAGGASRYGLITGMRVDF